MKRRHIIRNVLFGRLYKKHPVGCSYLSAALYLLAAAGLSLVLIWIWRFNQNPLISVFLFATVSASITNSCRCLLKAKLLKWEAEAEVSDVGIDIHQICADVFRIELCAIGGTALVLALAFSIWLL